MRPPTRRSGSQHVFHQYVVRTAEREKLQADLLARGIETAVHYRLPVHRQPTYIGRVALGPSGCRTTDQLVDQILSLPMFPEMTDIQVEYVVRALQTM